MSEILTIHRRIHFATAERRKVLREKKDATDPSRPPGRIPRVARLLALAMHVEHSAKRSATSFEVKVLIRSDCRHKALI